MGPIPTTFKAYQCDTNDKLHLYLHSGNLTQLPGKWGPRIESMYFLLKMAIFQPAMLGNPRG